ncbi:MAG: hypothetical protein K2H84_05720 [Paramuribaculum sp.]|nr:hypothetical protein [Paramuribaculum sp.]
MDNTRKTFVFNTDWYRIIKNCSTQIKGEVFTAVMEYAMSGIIPEISNEAYVIFQFIKREIDHREVRRKRNMTATTAKTVAEITKESAEAPESSHSLESSTPPEPTVTSNPPTPLPPLRLTRQMRRKLQRQGIDPYTYLPIRAHG